MEWAELAQRQDGVISRAQLRRTGCSDAAIGRLVGSGALHPQARGIYLVRGAPLTYRAELWVALLATGGVLGFATAAHWWGVEAKPPLRVEILVPTTRSRHAPSPTSSGD